MRIRKNALGAALVLALASSVVAGSASAQGRATTATAVATTGELVRVATPGIYGIHLTITTAAGRRSVVALRIGGSAMTIRAGARGERSQLTLRVTIRGRALAIHAADPDATLRLSVSVQRLGPLAEPPADTGTTAGTNGGSPAGTTSGSGTGATIAPPAGSPSGASGPPGDPSSWQMIFDDEFNGSSLDTSNWSTGWFGSGITAPVNSEELECYDPAQVVEGAGELDLNLIAQSETCGGQTRPYASGLVSTAGKFTFTYGYVEVRAWLPGGSTISDWPGIWTDGQSWPTDGELDLVEGLGGQACWHFHDPQGAPGGCEPGSSYTGGWHTYGADWEPGSVTYYYDGTVVGTITTGITSAPMYLVLDLAADNEYGGPVAAPATLRIDYVRVWQQAS